MANKTKPLGRPPRNGRDHAAVRDAIRLGCGLYETVRRTGVSMYMYYRIKKELRQPELRGRREGGEDSPREG